MFCADVWIGDLKVRVSTGRGYSYHFEGHIYVDNLSYNKIVGIHLNFDGAWRDINATYSRSLVTQGGNRVEEWTIDGYLSSTSFRPSHIQYAAYYHNVDLQKSHWDNNRGADYFAPVLS